MMIRDLFDFPIYLTPAIPNGTAVARNAGRWRGVGFNWATPLELFKQLDREFGFTLDVCAEDWNAKCTNFFTAADNGLMQDWGVNRCFMNPPYGKSLGRWMAKAFTSCLNGATVVCLVPAATDTDWWHRFAMRGEIRFLRGRPRFLTAQGKWQQTFTPSVIIVFGEQTRMWSRPFDRRQ